MANEGTDGKPVSKLTRTEQAAILLMSVGEVTAAEILKHMGPKEVQRLGTAMTQLKDVQQFEVEIVLSNFMAEVRTQTGLGLGSDSYIRNMLVTALGEDKANGLIDRILLGGNTTGSSGWRPVRWRTLFATNTRKFRPLCWPI
jgi:flagellar motor switch protein FliG